MNVSFRDVRKALGITVFLLVSPAFANQCKDKSVTRTDLGTLGGTRSSAVSINSAGQVVGWSETSTGQTHAFLWQKGVMTDLGTLGGPSSSATGINDLGQIVGTSETRTGRSHAFIWKDGEMTDLGIVSGPDSAANGINNTGQVVGYVGDIYANTYRAFLWQKGEVTDLGTLGGGNSTARAINSSGQVVGSSNTASEDNHAFIWQDGVMTDLGTLSGLGESDAFDINDNGQVVGFSTEQTKTSYGPYSFIWEKGKMASLKFSHLKEFMTNQALSINNGGEVVGYLSTPSSEISEIGYLYEKGISCTLKLEGEKYATLAGNINDSGQVVGSAGVDPSHGHATMWKIKKKRDKTSKETADSF